MTYTKKVKTETITRNNVPYNKETVTINFDCLEDLYNWLLLTGEYRGLGLLNKYNSSSFIGELTSTVYYDYKNEGHSYLPYNKRKGESKTTINYKNKPIAIDLDGTLNFYEDSAVVELELWELEIWKEEQEAEEQKKITELNKVKNEENKGFILLGLIALLPLLYVIFGGFIFFNDWEERFGHAAIGSIAAFVISNNISSHKIAQKNKGTFTCE